MHVTRRTLREKALQILYAYSLTGDPIEEILYLQLTDITKKDDREFCEKLVICTIQNSSRFEELIKDTVEHWDMERIALIDSILIKMCLTEFLYFEDIPPKVSINEYIDIAKDYSTVNSGKFVNGVLDALLEKLKKDQLIRKQGKGLLEGS